MAFRRRRRYTEDVLGVRFDPPPANEEPPPTPSIEQAEDALADSLDAGELVMAVLIGGVDCGGVHVAFTQRAIWLAGGSWEPMHKIPTYELTAVRRVEGGIVIEAGSNKLPIRVWDAGAANEFVAKVTSWLEDAAAGPGDT